MVSAQAVLSSVSSLCKKNSLHYMAALEANICFTVHFNETRKSKEWIVLLFTFANHILYSYFCKSAGCEGRREPCLYLIRSTSCETLFAIEFYSLRRLEDIFYRYGADIIIQSYGAAYERSYPQFKGVPVNDNYTNPLGPVHIITGGASPWEMEYNFTETQRKKN